MTSIPVPAQRLLRRTERHQDRPVVIAFAIGTAVSIGLGVYGRLHTPAMRSTSRGFPAAPRPRRHWPVSSWAWPSCRS